MVANPEGSHWAMVPPCRPGPGPFLVLRGLFWLERVNLAPRWLFYIKNLKFIYFF